MKLRFGGAWPAFKGCCWPNTRAAAAGPSGFTLIELLVVVSIISILAAMAVPNYLEAQTRAKWAVVKSDMRTLSVAIESYAVDHADYPIRRDISLNNPPFPRLANQMSQMSAITTPIAYLTTLPVDPFVKSQVPAEQGRGGASECYPMTNYQVRNKRLIDYVDPWQVKRTLAWIPDFYFRNEEQRDWRSLPDGTYALVSVGPDGYAGMMPKGGPADYPCQPSQYVFTYYDIYDSTNGVSSAGNVYRIPTLLESPMKLFFKNAN